MARTTVSSTSQNTYRGYKAQSSSSGGDYSGGYDAAAARAAEEERRRKKREEYKVVMNVVIETGKKVLDANRDLNSAKRALTLYATGALCDSIKNGIEKAQEGIGKIINGINAITEKAKEKIKENGEIIQNENLKPDYDAIRNAGASVGFSCDPARIREEVLKPLQNANSKLKDASTTGSNAKSLEGCENVKNVPSEIDDEKSAIDKIRKEVEQFITYAEEMEKQNIGLVDLLGTGLKTMGSWFSGLFNKDDEREDKNDVSAMEMLTQLNQNSPLQNSPLKNKQNEKVTEMVAEKLGVDTNGKTKAEVAKDVTIKIWANEYEVDTNGKVDEEILEEIAEKAGIETTTTTTKELLLEVPLIDMLEYQSTPWEYLDEGTIAERGCGPTVFSMLASWGLGYVYTPDNLLADHPEYMYKYSIEEGTSDSMFRENKDLDEYNLKFEGNYYWEEAWGEGKLMEALANGCIAVYRAGPESEFTDNGHFILLTGLTEDGNIKVNDPNGANYTLTKYLKDGFANGFNPKDFENLGRNYYIFSRKDSEVTTTTKKTESQILDEINQKNSGTQAGGLVDKINELLGNGKVTFGATNTRGDNNSTTIEKDNADSGTNNNSSKQNVFGTLFNTLPGYNSFQKAQLEDKMIKSLAEKYGVETNNKPKSVILNEINGKITDLSQNVQYVGSSTPVQNEKIEKYPEIPLFDQNDYRDITLFKQGNVADQGCGLVAYSMVLTYLFDDHENYTIEKLAEKYEGTYSGKWGTSYELFDETPQSYGLKVEKCYSGKGWGSSNKIVEALKNNQPVIAYVSEKSGLTGSGHYVVLTGLTEDGKVLVNDPNGNNYNKESLKDGFENGFDIETFSKDTESGYWIFPPKDTSQYEKSSTVGEIASPLGEKFNLPELKDDSQSELDRDLNILEVLGRETERNENLGIKQNDANKNSNLSFIKDKNNSDSSTIFGNETLNDIKFESETKPSENTKVEIKNDSTNYDKVKEIENMSIINKLANKLNEIESYIIDNHVITLLINEYLKEQDNVMVPNSTLKDDNSLINKVNNKKIVELLANKYDVNVAGKTAEDVLNEIEINNPELEKDLDGIKKLINSNIKFEAETKPSQSTKVEINKDSIIVEGLGTDVAREELIDIKKENANSKENSDIIPTEKDDNKEDKTTEENKPTSDKNTNKPSNSKPSTGNSYTNTETNVTPTVPENTGKPIVGSTSDAIIEAAKNADANSHSEYISEILHEAGYLTEKEMRIFKDYSIQEMCEKFEEFRWDKITKSNKLQVGDIIITNNKGKDAIYIYAGDSKWYSMDNTTAQQMKKDWAENMTWWAYRPTGR